MTKTQSLIKLIDKIISRELGRSGLPKKETCPETRKIADKVLAWEGRERKRKREHMGGWWRLKKYRLIRVIEMFLLEERGIPGQRGIEYEGEWWDTAYLIATAIFERRIEC